MVVEEDENFLLFVDCRVGSKLSVFVFEVGTALNAMLGEGER